MHTDDDDDVRYTLRMPTQMYEIRKIIIIKITIDTVSHDTGTIFIARRPYYMYKYKYVININSVYLY